MNALTIVLAISSGAAIGALARFGLSALFNNLLPQIPMGTLASNLIAAYIIGCAIGYASIVAELPTVWRLFIITGLAGGLSTFSTFTGELLTLLRNGQLLWSAGMITVHVCGSLIFMLLGIWTVNLVRGSQ